MATRTISRRALRDQNDEAEQSEPDDEGEAVAGEDTPKPRARKKTKLAKVKDPSKPPRARRKTVKVPPLMFARWAICDNGMKRVAVFEYRDRAGADAKLAEVRERKAGTFFILLVKDPYDPPAEPAAPAVTA